MTSIELAPFIDILMRISPDRIAKSIEQRLAQRCLPLEAELWNGQRIVGTLPVKARISICNVRGLEALLKPTLGNLAKSYVEQDIAIEGKAQDIIRLAESLCDVPAPAVQRPSRISRWLHSRAKDWKAISYHYDVSNDFFKLWLDRQLVYSCAYFRSESDSLDLAQEQKLDHICRKLDLKPGERLLDIGCGWGALIFWAARHYGVQAMGITLSRNQFRYISDQIWHYKLRDCCQVRLLDYRDIPESETFHKIASVGMFEHVGIKNLPLYFGKIHRLLKPGGLVMNHGITTIGVDGFGLDSDVTKFIDQYVFPDGELTHVSHVVKAMAEQNLECLDAECLRPHYTRTIWHWVDRLEAGKQEAIRLVGEKKFRIWQIYMAGSAWAFERGWPSIYQLLAGKPRADGSLPYPLTREHIYSKRNQDSNVVALGGRSK